ncbi:hypothetical protein SEA_WEASELS2_207 [Rhodococcus phage Weasels2]|uniref:Uncharacterized protein n=1 Tax=Rhodococcus phage Weasels2 TaxID=1897437 RepID=A0A1I9SAH9_9CAUD|nr:hypothetical protein FDH04_gp209 [Rhodococcus phage Weasels2]AOZ63785.1 hypothetical protein SEA_WEASELS2_207 [Rhodococcus phage Weasels2]
MDKQEERPDLTKWRKRDEIRRSSAASPVPSGKVYQRKHKHVSKKLDRW